MRRAQTGRHIRQQRRDAQDHLRTRQSSTSVTRVVPTVRIPRHASLNATGLHSSHPTSQLWDTDAASLSISVVGKRLQRAGMSEQCNTCSPAMASMPFTSSLQGLGSCSDRDPAQSAVTPASVLRASALWCSCTAAVFSKGLRQPPLPQYSSGTNFPSMRGKVLYACPASSPATKAPAQHDALAMLLRATQGAQALCGDRECTPGCCTLPLALCNRPTQTPHLRSRLGWPYLRARSPQ